jgi:hypothetical protein
MMESVLNVAEYKLTDLLSSAGATIGVIIAGTIFLQFLSTKYLELGVRYRALTSEYRSGAGDVRHGLLQCQIRAYRRRLRLMNRASWLAAVALLCFIVAVLAGGLSMAYPPVRIFKWVGTAGLGVGLVLIGSALVLELVESILAERDHLEEVGDLDDPVKECPEKMLF